MRKMSGRVKDEVDVDERWRNGGGIEDEGRWMEDE